MKRTLKLRRVTSGPGATLDTQTLILFSLHLKVLHIQSLHTQTNPQQTLLNPLSSQTSSDLLTNMALTFPTIAFMSHHNYPPMSLSLYITCLLISRSFPFYLFFCFFVRFFATAVSLSLLQLIHFSHTFLLLCSMTQWCQKRLKNPNRQQKGLSESTDLCSSQFSLLILHSSTLVKHKS